MRVLRLKDYDSVNYGYVIPESDNRVRVALMCVGANRIWYSCVEHLAADGKWWMFGGSAQTHRSQVDAETRLNRLYNGEWKEYSQPQ